MSERKKPDIPGYGDGSNAFAPDSSGAGQSSAWRDQLFASAPRSGEDEDTAALVTLTGLPAGGEEDALRALLHGAVDDLAPREGVLDHLRYAVPARRARRRQLMVGAAALLVLAVASVPALLRTGGIGGDGGRPLAVASSPATPESGESPDGGTSGEVGGGDSTHGGGEQGEATQGPHDGTDGTGSGGGPNGTKPVSAPPCKAGDLVEESATTSPPDSRGNVTGQIKMANASSAPCSVAGAGSVRTVAADARIDTAQHTDGDVASGLLPAVAPEPEPITLAAGEAYVLAFAFVPAPEAAETCPATGPDTPAPGPTEGTDTNTPTGDTGEVLSNTTTQLMVTDTGGANDGTPPPPETTEVAITHTPEGGGRTATVTVPATCAGTVFYTPPLEG
ncbi:hypothetical protein SRB5_52100 [Streptomyces sp. RB5]|uniref:DUF4232 domain-containing protein n=1 Tax=Streptomyces smaragdinus TaxID=2585196 RepID=A0A7K0CP16_9ACTN|nr:hypothetical protein [Streptomyces smaragdinus]MQY15033.1 hypothetical protein [Streptomyces smaragdinus]